MCISKWKRRREGGMAKKKWSNRSLSVLFPMRIFLVGRNSSESSKGINKIKAKEMGQRKETTSTISWQLWFFPESQTALGMGMRRQSNQTLGSTATLSIVTFFSRFLLPSLTVTQDDSKKKREKKKFWHFCNMCLSFSCSHGDRCE